MTQYDNTNKGALFKNSRREKDTQPEYNGTVNVEGRDYWISAWIKEGKSGKFFSISVKRKDGTASRPEPAQKQVFGGGSPDLDDAVPFSPEFR